MAYIRIKRIKGNEYAYLVENKWMKKTKKPKQKVKAYLGRFYPIEVKEEKDFFENYDIEDTEKYFSERTANQIIKELFEFEIIKAGLPEIKIDMDKKAILYGNSNVVLGINGGYLCTYTLRKLINFKFDEQEELGYGLAKAFADAGINVPKVVFVEVFNKMVGG